MIKRSLLAGATVALAFAIPGAAAAQSGYGYAPQNSACERQRSDDKLAGGVAGALVGGLIGGAIGNNIDSGDDHYRGRRGHRGYGRGHHRRGYSHGYRRDDDNSDQVVVGALLGALVGGVAGSQMASGSNANCGLAGPTPYQPSNTYRGGTYQGSSIPRTTDGLYGGPDVMDQRGYPYNQPPARTYPASSYPDDGYSDQGYDDGGYSAQGYDDQAYYGEQTYSQQECRMIYQNGGHVRACRNNPTETWRVVNDQARDEELYGY
ncbi:hypothetical protein [Hyphomonas sp.]|uniref:hypothetical protein n=1 Tax=Hyphomonas sp. TaxID=87 RepID=UPI003D2C71DC|tara:strand:- start:83006 stop:83794 length:789 start_codon:yes stop_codon:yes gene_type:complete